MIDYRLIRQTMNEFLGKIAGILEVDRYREEPTISSHFAQWDSLAVLSVIAMLDANYGVNLRAADLQAAVNRRELFGDRCSSSKAS